MTRPTPSLGSTRGVCRRSSGLPVAASFPGRWRSSVWGFAASAGMEASSRSGTRCRITRDGRGFCTEGRSQPFRLSDGLGCVACLSRGSRRACLGRDEGAQGSLLAPGRIELTGSLEGERAQPDRISGDRRWVSRLRGQAACHMHRDDRLAGATGIGKSRSSVGVRGQDSRQTRRPWGCSWEIGRTSTSYSTA